MGENSVTDEHQFRPTPVQQMIASCTGALLTSMLVTPLDVVKVRLQYQQKALLSKKCCFIYCNGLMDHVCQSDGKTNAWLKRPGHFTSFGDAFVKIVRNEGVTSLWSGLAPTLVMAVPLTIIYFVSYDNLRTYLIDRYRAFTGEKEYPAYLPLVAGGFARLWVVTIFSPLELIRTKLQSKKTSFQELKLACAELYETRGIIGFWLGYVPSISRDVPFSAIYWGCYELQKKVFGMQKEEVPLSFSFLAGATAASIAGTVTLPFDVVKTHKQLEMGEADFNVKGRKLPNTADIVKTIYRQTGITGLFTGLTPRLVKVAPACAIMLSTYECGKNFFVNYNRNQSAN